MVVSKKWKRDVAVLDHSVERVTQLGGAGAKAVAYAPDIGPVAITKHVRPIDDERRADELRQMYTELSKSTEIGTLIVRASAPLPLTRALLDEYRETVVNR